MMPWVTIGGNHVFIDRGKATLRKPTLNDLTVEEVDRIATAAKTLKTLPLITSRKGEAITVSIHTNPFHGVLDRSEAQKPYGVKTHVDGVLNDHVPFRDYAKAEKYAGSWHRQLTREERKGR